MPHVTIPISMRQGLTTSHAMSVAVAGAISTGMASGLNVPNALGRAVLLALGAGAPGNAFKTVRSSQSLRSPRQHALPPHKRYEKPRGSLQHSPRAWRTPACEGRR